LEQSSGRGVQQRITKKKLKRFKEGAFQRGKTLGKGLRQRTPTGQVKGPEKMTPIKGLNRGGA